MPTAHPNVVLIGGLRGIRNFMDLCRPLGSTWRVYDDSFSEGPRLVARGGRERSEETFDEGTWNRIQRA